MTQEDSASGHAGAAEVIRRFRDTLRKTQFMPPERLREYQRGLLERLVRHTRAHVPFYRDSGRLDPLFRGDDTIDWDRWDEIPLLTRKDVQDEFERLKSEFVPPEHGRTFVMSTSGSTGEPVKVLQTELASRWACTAQRLRDFEWHRIDPTKTLAILYPFTPEDFDIDSIRRNPAWRPEFVALGLAGERIDIVSTRPVTGLVEKVASVRPVYLEALPTLLELMVAHDSKRLLAELDLAAIFIYGEHCSNELQRQLEEYFRCKVLDIYGSCECTCIAGSCPHCGRFHVRAEVVLVETITEDGRAALSGEIGRLLVTPFYNYAMPLIRYDHADFAQMGAPDQCQFTLPSLHKVIGKQRVPFIFPGGRSIRPNLPASTVIEFLGAQVYQVAQVAPDRCEFRIVPGSLAPAEMRFDDMTELIHAIWWEGLQIDYRIMEVIAGRTPRAKFDQFVQEFLASTSGA